MRPVSAIFLSALTSLALTAVHPTAARADDKAPPKFAGVWNLNTKASDSMQQKMGDLNGSGGGGHWGGGHGGGGGFGGGGFGGGMRHGGGGGWGGGGGEGRGGPDGEGGSADGEGASPHQGGGRGQGGDMRDLFRPPMTMLIEQTDSTLVMSERGQTLQVLALGDPKIVGAAIEPDVPHSSARWKGSSLIAERQTRRGGKLTQTYSLDGAGKTLTIVTRIEPQGQGPTIELKRVYDRYEGD
jgi:hypothetical protein